METFKATVGFTPSNNGEKDDPVVVDTSALLKFRKGEQFLVLCKENKRWWAVRSLKNDSIGFVPAEFLKELQVKRDCDLTDEEKVSREQHMRLLMELQKKSGFQHPDRYYGEMLPDPDYSDSDSEQTPSPEHRRIRPTLNGSINEEGLIVPKKLPNPCLESRDRVDLHKELKFNQKTGKNVLGQKTELQKVLDKFQEDQRRKEEEIEKLSKRTTFEIKLEEQANKIKQMEENSKETKTESPTTDSEFMRVHAKVRARKDS